MPVSKVAWQYGEAGDQYPLDFGDVVQIGPHIVACGDLEKGQGEQCVEMVGRSDIAYVDPPWNQGNISSFRTKAGVSTGLMFMAQFIDVFLGVLKTTQGPIYIEMGKQE